MKALAAIGALALAVAAAAAQTSQQFWPEVNLQWRPVTQWRFIAVAESKRFSESDELEHAAGADVDYFWRSNVYTRVGFLRQITHQQPHNKYESRGIIETTVSGVLIGTARWVDRPRVDFRWIDGEYSWRLRDRVRVEHDAGRVGRVKLVPYGMVEPFYDSRFNSVVRVRMSLGAEFELSHVTLDLSYLRQNQTRSSPPRVNAADARLIVEF